MGLTVRKCTIDDLAGLREISEVTFKEAYREICPEEGMGEYLKEAFSMEEIKREFEDPGSEFFAVFKDDEILGYMKLNEAPVQTDIYDEKLLELQRIYVYDGDQNLGYGSHLIERAIEEAEKRKKDYIWLGVWSGNERAISFYRRYGFCKSGEYMFDVGGDLYSNIIMKKDL